MLTALSLLCVTVSAKADNTKVDTLTLFNEATFYDGYLFDKNPDSLVSDGILRHSTSLYAVKLKPEQLALIGDSLCMDVFVKACCDNYDRIGNINLAFVPKGDTTYIPDSTTRIEIGRFITPFMNKNKQPDVVPYNYHIDYVANILRDQKILADYDIWVEFELFGVPYAANQQVAGCAGRSDVFKGTLKFSTWARHDDYVDRDVLVPICMKKPEYRGGNLNNYNEQATDTLGKTVKTWHFTVPENVSDAQLVLITSNHGANSGGEEYNRRWHYVYVDDSLMLVYKPGRTTCEPFRKYNTQANGIYGYTKRSDETWQSFSNWCPGDVIDNRIISFGGFSAGDHTVRISVPEAVFADKQGDIPVSMFFQGVTEGSLPSGISWISVPDYKVNVAANDGQLHFSASGCYIFSVSVYNLSGDRITEQMGSQPINTTRWAPGVYLANLELDNNLIVTKKVLVK